MSIEILMNNGVHAYGMSITTGQSAANSVNQWVNRLSAFIGGAASNRAIGGTGLPSYVSQVNTFTPYGGRTALAVVDGPLNDVRQCASACLPSIKGAYDAIVSSLFSGYFRGAQWPSPNVVKTGTWTSLGTSYGGRSCFWSGYAPMSTVDPSASITFQFTGPIVALHGFASESGDWLDMDIEIDGAAWGSTAWAGKARPGAGKQAVATIIDGLSAGSHTIKVKPQSTGIPAGKCCVVDGIQCPLSAAPVILGNIPNIADWAKYGSIGTWADAQAANVIIAQVVTDWKARGYPIELANVAGFIDPSRDFVGGDDIHPLDRGHLNWALSYMSVIRIKP